MVWRVVLVVFGIIRQSCGFTRCWYKHLSVRSQRHSIARTRVESLRSFADFFKPKYNYKINENLIDYYRVLGVERNATLTQIRRSYRSRIALVHPDTDPSATAARKFDLITEAHETLRDERKRSAYDGALFAARVAQVADKIVDDIVIPFIRDDVVPVVQGGINESKQAVASIDDSKRNASTVVATAAAGFFTGAFAVWNSRRRAVPSVSATNAANNTNVIVLTNESATSIDSEQIRQSTSPSSSQREDSRRFESSSDRNSTLIASSFSTIQLEREAKGKEYTILSERSRAYTNNRNATTETAGT